MNYTHVVLTRSGDHIYITESQYIKYKNADLPEYGVINFQGSKIKVKDIVSVLPLEKKPIVDRIPVNSMPSLIKGLDRAITEFKVTGYQPYKAIALLNRFKDKIKP